MPKAIYIVTIVFCLIVLFAPLFGIPSSATENQSAPPESNPPLSYVSASSPHPSAPNTTAPFALLNLILTIFGVSTTIFLIIHAKLFRRNSNNVYKTKIITSNIRRYRIFGATLIILSTISIALLLYTQSLSRFIVLFDNWTLPHAVLFLSIAICGFFANKRIEEYEYVITETTIIK